MIPDFSNPMKVKDVRPGTIFVKKYDERPFDKYRDIYIKTTDRKDGCSNFHDGESSWHYYGETVYVQQANIIYAFTGEYEQFDKIPYGKYFVYKNQLYLKGYSQYDAYNMYPEAINISTGEIFTFKKNPTVKKVVARVCYETKDK